VSCDHGAKKGVVTRFGAWRRAILSREPEGGWRKESVAPRKTTTSKNLKRTVGFDAFKEELHKGRRKRPNGRPLRDLKGQLSHHCTIPLHGRGRGRRGRREGGAPLQGVISPSQKKDGTSAGYVSAKIQKRGKSGYNACFQGKKARLTLIAFSGRINIAPIFGG